MTRREFSLERCQANQHHKSGKDAACSQTGKEMNDKVKTSPVSDATLNYFEKELKTRYPSLHRIVAEETTRFRERQKMLRPTWTECLAKPFGIFNSRGTLIKHIQETGEMRLALSPIAAKLYKDGKALGLVVRKVGTRLAFDMDPNRKSVWVTVGVKYGELSISKA